MIKVQSNWAFHIFTFKYQQTCVFHNTKWSFCKLDALRSAARLVLRLPPRASVTQLMRDRLHWLPVQQRITFKLCTLAFKCSHGLAPVYLSRFCTSVATVEARARLRSAASGQLLVPVTRMSTMGRRGFYYACPATRFMEYACLPGTRFRLL